MAIHTNLYLLVFLPLVLITYQLVPRKARWGVLLAASYALYISFSKYLVLLLMATAAFTYAIGRWMDKIGNDCEEKQKECTDRKQKSEVKKAFQKKLKRGSRRTTGQGGGWVPRPPGLRRGTPPPGLIKPRSRSKVNKPGGVRLWRRVGKDRGGKGRQPS